MKRKINKKAILYGLYAIFVLIFFLYARFPGKVMENYIVATLAERYPGVFLSLESVTVAFPPGLKLQNISFGFKDNLEASVLLDTFALRPRFLGYLSGQPSFVVSANAYDGTVKGVVPDSYFSGKASSAKAEVKFEGLTLEKCAYLQDKLGRRITGKLGGSFVYNDGVKVDITVKNGSYQLLENLYGLDKLDFSAVEAQISAKGNALKINNLKLKGDKISCSLKGDIILNAEVRNSEINLSGTMEIASLSKKKISMVITGTLGNAQSKYL